jgi:hypothetical protein
VESEHKHAVYIFLPTGRWADASALRNIHATVFAVVVHHPTSVKREVEEPLSVFVTRAMKMAEDAGFWPAGLQWAEDKLNVSG